MTIEAVLPHYLDGASISGLDRLHGGMETDVFRFDADGRPLVLRVYACGDPTPYIFWSPTVLTK